MGEENLSPLVLKWFAPPPPQLTSHSPNYLVLMILDGDTDDLDISDCMVFFSGTERLPPTGFDTECTLNFNSCNVYPTASTCALTLTLPTKYHDDLLSL